MTPRTPREVSDRGVMVSLASPPIVRRACVGAALALLLAAAPASGALRSVSGFPDPASDEVLADGAKEDVAYSLANGFPLWYRDASGLTLELCDDQHAELVAGVQSTPCLTAEPFPSFPRSFPLNHGTEAFYWTASAFQAFTSETLVLGVPTLVAGNVLVVLSLEASFQNLVPIDGQQAVFSRIRVRATLPHPGFYKVTHPYGEVTYEVVGGLERQIDQSQDVGNMPTDLIGAPLPPGGPPPQGDFTLALRDGPTPPVGPFDPSIDVGIVSTVAAGLGPFLVPAATPGGPALDPVIATDGRRFLADPGNDIVPRTVHVRGSPLGPDDPAWNVFTIELLNPPTGFFLNATDRTQRIVIDRFQLAGKIFDGGANTAPVAAPETVVTAKGAPVAIDVVANDVDVVDPVTNRHGIDPQAFGLPSNDPADPAGTILIARPLVTANGGTVERTTDIATGEMVFLYTPAPGFSGADTFEYVVQDRGGLLSAPATVTVLVEDVAVAEAEYRARSGRWRIRGTASGAGASTVAIHASPRTVLTAAGVVPPAQSGAKGVATFRALANAIDFRIALDPLPASVVTAVHLHLGAPGEDGPLVLFLYDAPVHGPFTGVRSATLTPARLLPVPGLPALTFADVVRAVLSGNAYVDVHTAALPAGELRGQVSSPLVATVPVDPATGLFTFAGPSSASPGGPPASVSVVSSQGIRAVPAPLRVR
jgi:hypothetical protein